MEPRARAGKNVGKMNFAHNELAQLLYGHGDVKAPLPDTVRVLDEVLTDFIQGVGFEATRAAHHAGRQKVKFEDFEFAMRRNPRFMGKIQEVFEKKKEIEAARKNFSIEDQLMRDADREEKQAEKKADRKTDRETDKERLTSAAAAADATAAASTTSSNAASVRGTKRPRPAEEELDEGDDDLEADADIVGTAAKRR